MDLGAILCTRNKPRCGECPLQPDCKAYRSGQQAAFPTPGPTKTLPVRHTTFVIVQDPAGEVLLERRPPTGIWGGLWSFPECPAGVDPLKWCRDELGYRVQAAEHGSALQHTFSHFRLLITPLYVRVQERAQGVMESRPVLWYKDTDPRPLGLAAPVAKLMKNLKRRSSAEEHIE